MDVPLDAALGRASRAERATWPMGPTETLSHSRVAGDPASLPPPDRTVALTSRARWRTRNRPGRTGPGGAVRRFRGAVGRQPRVARAWLKVADGRMTAAALAGSGW
ncbi:hypothetical protein Shyhy02_16020 [Streptomyces hygroscopicus subsp. hygroscopicus]|nr:hypothetical protein Shyhy02_16020 [Streptomyces hygroscopicus subsp. hygroscopicus]